MHKKLILKIDLASKALIFFLGVGVWILALKPLAPATAYTQSEDSGPVAEQDSKPYKRGPALYEKVNPSAAALYGWLKSLQTDYGFTCTEAHLHCIMWILLKNSNEGSFSVDK